MDPQSYIFPGAGLSIENALEYLQTEQTRLQDIYQRFEQFGSGDTPAGGGGGSGGSVTDARIDTFLTQQSKESLNAYATDVSTQIGNLFSAFFEVNAVALGAKTKNTQQQTVIEQHETRLNLMDEEELIQVNRLDILETAKDAQATAITNINNTNSEQNIRLNNLETQRDITIAKTDLLQGDVDRIDGVLTGGTLITTYVLDDILRGFHIMRRYTGQILDIIPRLSAGTPHTGTVAYSLNLGTQQNFTNLNFFDNDSIYPSIIDGTCSGISRSQVATIVTATDGAKNIKIDLSILSGILNNLAVFSALGRKAAYIAGTTNAGSAFKYRVKGRLFIQWAVPNGTPLVVYPVAIGRVQALTHQNINDGSLTVRLNLKAGGTGVDARTETLSFEGDWSNLSTITWVGLAIKPSSGAVTVYDMSNLTLSIEVQPCTFYAS